MESGILSFGIRNKALGIRIPTGVWNPESKDWNPEPGIVGIHGVESRIRQDCPVFLYMGRKISILTFLTPYLLSHRGKLSSGTNSRLPLQRYLARLDDVVTATSGGGRGEKRFQQAIPSNCEISHRDAQIEVRRPQRVIIDPNC